MSENQQAPYQKGKKKRETLRLPTLHFVAADDWMGKLGHEEFCAWLKFHTWVDRKDANREYDKIPMSLEASWEKLGVSKSKFYRLIKPMWEFGLIDIIDYKESTRIGQKPKNIIVYEYPFHDETKMFLPLEKLRDWNQDYQSKSKDAGKIGGRPRKGIKEDDQELIEEQEEKRVEKPAVVHRFKIKTVDRFKFKTVTVSKLKPNNVLNNSINYQITPINYQKENLSILNSIKQLNIPQNTIELLEKQIDRLILLNVNLLEIELVFKEFQSKISRENFDSVLYDVLQAKKINTTMKKYLTGAINNFLTNQSNQVNSKDADVSKQAESSYESTAKTLNFKKKYVREEPKPEWMGKSEEAGQQEAAATSESDLEERKRKLEENLKKLRS